jgi:GR25 family glycosyltransferase involved in LPS biosynthesis
LRSFIISAANETARAANISELRKQLPDAIMINAVYPSITKVPFLQQLIKLSQQRTGKALLPAEIGCLLSHRKVWHNILQMDIDAAEHCLVVESDSIIKDMELVKDLFSNNIYNDSINSSISGEIKNSRHLNISLQQYDLFFFGAWLGHMKLLRSTKKQLNERFSIGQPFIKTVYCTYGYSVNKKAAAYLLQQTKKIAYPVDQFKHFIQPEALQIGGVVPELISAGTMGSYINQINAKQWQRNLFMYLLDIKNNLICFFK